ncbi:nucleolar protein 8-like [Asterias rubens]|uniref:nucleolar protein 8-like n=1 Tax=Asterias rubens TaxID=7604 RepID=UPI001455C8E4|nr:nucleolar protein 8-like [Asterias rubens]XP_033645332.1 nucleolar protein 8-like [Asterias rubens]XP_033645340.1 nucleolar protein 8-like [Asterias rubens]
MPEADQAKDAAKLSRLRLFVGGLHEDVTTPDLRQRFGKFGSVSSVDISLKRDAQGTVANVFAHMDIDITQANFKKCVSTYNNAKWKGHAMRVQVAKDSFLTKLEAERKAHLENEDDEKPVVRKTLKMKEQEEAMAKLEENLNKAGVENFILKAAVPGTPIPGEDSWIVGKFGRVLPIMHMRRRDKRSHMTYDPSKYGHYLRKFKENPQNDQLMSESSVTKLTWHLPEEKSAMDRKRMGEFPDCGQKKKSKTQLQSVLTGQKINEKSQPQQFQRQIGGATSHAEEQNSFEVVKVKRKENKKEFVKLWPITANETDTEANIAQSKKEQREDVAEVGEVLKQCQLESDNESCGSADTDEICNITRKPDRAGKQVLSNWADDYYHKERVSLILSDGEYNIRQENYLENKVENPDPGLGLASADVSSLKMHEGVSSYGQRTSGDTDAILEESFNEEDNMGINESAANGEGDKDDDEDESDAKDEGKIDKHNLEEDEESENDTSDEDSEEEESNSEEDFEFTKNLKEDHFGGEDEVEDSDEDDDEEDGEIDAKEDVKDIEKIKRGDLGGDEEVEDSDEDDEAEGSESDSDDSDEDDDEDDESDASKDIEIKEDHRLGDDQDQDDDSDEDDKSSAAVITEDLKKSPHKEKIISLKDNTGILNKNPKNKMKGDEEDSDDSNDSSDSSDSIDVPQKAGKISKPGSVKIKGGKRALSDKIRLESVKKRQAAVLHQKTAIQEALKAVDSRKDTGSGRHMRFDSDEEGESLKDVKAGNAVKTETKKLSGLFDSDDEEEMEIDEEADEERFKIKPQFLGKAGEKLMKLQDRFGTDSRFKMGVNFMEDDEEDLGALNEDDEDQQEEKQRSLAILQGIVGSQAMNSLKHKTTSNFKDPSQMRYDPSRDDHAQFEIHNEEPVKQKKTKARDEVAPEVGREKYFEVAKLDIGKEAVESQPFSFFGETEIEEEEDVTGISSLQRDILAATKQGKRQLALDSSDEESDEEEVEEEEVEEKQGAEGDAPSDPPKPVSHTFFFLDDDARLKTGPQLFCRTLSNEALNKWFEQQKTDLQGEYKKRHQKAVRDVKAAQQRSRKASQKRAIKASR